MPHCLNCSRAAAFRCACCADTHYCSAGCQHADWRALHRYEAPLLKLGALEDDDVLVERAGSVRVRSKPSPAQRRALDALRAHRRDYDETVAATLAHHAARVPGRLERRLTTREKKELAARLLLSAPSRETRRAAERERFTQTVAGVLSAVSELVAAPQIGEAEEAELSALFRGRDLLHAKRSLALVTRAHADAEAAAHLQTRLEQAERSFIHGLLGLEAAGVSLADVEAARQAALRAGQVERQVELLVEQAQRGCVDVCVEFLRGDTAQLLRFGGNADGELVKEDEEEEATYLENLRRLHASQEPQDANQRRLAYAQRQTVHSMASYSQFMSVARDLYVAQRRADAGLAAEPADTPSGEPRAYELGVNPKVAKPEPRISREQAEEDQRYLERVMAEAEARMRPVAEATVREQGRGFFARAYADIAARVDQAGDWVKKKLSVSLVARTFCVLLVVGFTLLAYGLVAYFYSALYSLDKVKRDVDELIDKAKGIKGQASDLRGMIFEETERIDELTAALDASQGNVFLEMNPATIDWASVKDTAVIHGTLEAYTKSISDILARPPEERSVIWERHAKQIQTLINLFRKAENVQSKRTLFRELHAYIKDSAKSMADIGVVHSLAQVQEDLDEQKAFVGALQPQADGLYKALLEQDALAEQVGANLKDARKVVKETTQGAPFLMTMLKTFGGFFPRALGGDYVASYLDPALVTPFANEVAAQFAYSMYNTKVVNTIQFMAQIEYQLGHLIQAAAGAFKDADNSWLDCIGAWAGTLFSWDTMTVVYHTLTGIVLLYNTARAALEVTRATAEFALGAERMGRATRWLSETMLASVAGTVAGFGEPRYDAELRKLRAQIEDEGWGTQEQRIQAALDAHEAGELGDWRSGWAAAVKYGRLVEMLYDRQDLYAGSAALQALRGLGPLWYEQGVQGALFFSRLAFYQYTVKHLLDFWWNLNYIVRWLYGALSWQGGSLLYAALALLSWAYTQGLRRPTATAWDAAVALLAPFNALLLLTYRQPFRVATVVYMTQSLMYWSNPRHVLLEFLTPSEEAAEAAKYGFSQGRHHIYESEKETQELLGIHNKELKHLAESQATKDADTYFEAVTSSLSTLMTLTGGANTVVKKMARQAGIFTRELGQ